VPPSFAHGIIRHFPLRSRPIHTALRTRSAAIQRELPTAAIALPLSGTAIGECSALLTSDSLPPAFPDTVGAKMMLKEVF